VRGSYGDGTERHAARDTDGECDECCILVADCHAGDDRRPRVHRTRHGSRRAHRGPVLQGQSATERCIADHGCGRHPPHLDRIRRICQPIANAKLDFWQADGNGSYDNSGYTLRGWQLTDASGAYRLETVIPGLYPGRTEHIHFKVTVNGQTYTSQLFFPGISQNASDSIYSAQMLVKLNTSTSPVTGTFTFVVNVA